MEYTNLSNLKEYISETSDENNVLLEWIIKKVTKVFDKYLGQNIWERKYWEYLWNIFDDYVLFPKFSPIQSISEVRVDNYPVKVKRFIEDIIYLNSPVFWEVFVEYTAWYKDLSEIPDIEEACLRMCKQIFNEIKGISDENIKQEKIDDLSIVYFSESEKSDNVFNYKNILENYKSIKPNLI